MSDDLTRLQAAIAAIHDHLHAGRVNEAHEACECAMNGDYVNQPNLTVPQSAIMQVFASKFNALAASLNISVAFVAFMPSATKPGCTSIQLGGEVEACKMVESMLGGNKSIYRGEHATARAPS